MNKSKEFKDNHKELARFARVISHPARLAILQYLAETKTCISGDISDSLPLSRSTVSQHLKELRNIGLIQGEIEGLKINYCLGSPEIERWLELVVNFFEPLTNAGVTREPFSKPKATLYLPEKKVSKTAMNEEHPDKSKDIFFF
ncbi:MAG: ArsR/SmtB family transcription factor [Lentimicrobium sp.]